MASEFVSDQRYVCETLSHFTYVHVRHNLKLPLTSSEADQSRDQSTCSVYTFSVIAVVELKCLKFMVTENDGKVPATFCYF